MEIEIKDLQEEDCEKAIQFAIKGMHFNWYVDNKFLLDAYGRYFWYLQINRATQIMAAYAGGEFVGVLLAEMKGGEKSNRIFSSRAMSKLLTRSWRLFSKAAPGSTKIQQKNSWRTIWSLIRPMEKSSFSPQTPIVRSKGSARRCLTPWKKRNKGKPSIFTRMMPVHINSMSTEDS